LIKDNISSILTLPIPPVFVQDLQNIKSSIILIDNKEDLSKKAFDNLFSLVYDKLEENKSKIDLLVKDFVKLSSTEMNQLPHFNQTTDKVVNLFQSSSEGNFRDKGKGPQKCHDQVEFEQNSNTVQNGGQNSDRNICSCHEKISELKLEHELLREVNNKLDHLIELGNQPILDINSKLLVMESNNDKMFNFLLEKFNSLQSSLVLL
jgi:hypothetical protein